MDLLSNAEKIINSPIQTSKQIIDEIINEFKNDKREIPINTGFKNLNRMFTGFKRNQITILAGRSSMGKTCVALNFVINLLNTGKKVLYFDLEEQKNQNYHRILSNITNYPLRDKLDNPHLTKFEKDLVLKTLETGRERFNDKGLFYVSKPNLTLENMQEMAANSKDIDVIVIDHLTKIKSKGSNIYERTTDTAGNLRQLSYNLGGIPLLVLAQINRGAEERRNKKPLLSDLKGSGEIEENADVVILLYAEGYYQEETPDEEPIYLNVAKNRHGRTGIAKLLINRPLQKIKEINKND
jgi:replicative DNA helicase